jgi:hypothetical protein
MKKLLLSILFMAIASSVYCQTYNITFQVDMTNVTGFTTPEVNGTFNNWCGACAPLSDANGDNIWELTIPLEAGVYEHKFAYDNWANGGESLVAGSSCTITSNGFTNRTFTVSQDSVLPVVCYGLCTACGVNNGPYNVTFQVDMTNVTGFTTPEVNGTFNGWCGACAPLSDANGDNIWELTIPLEPGAFEYKFAYDNWANGGESLLAGSSCTVTNNGFTNRALTVSQDTVLPVVCWESCNACGINNGPYNVTFKVDMNQSGQTFTTPEVNGTFNGWCGACAPLSDVDGDNIWELTIPLQPGAFEYKFAYDNWANGGESLTEGSTCTVTSNGFTNRSIIVSADTVLEAVCWASCNPCSTGIETSEKSNKGILAFPNPANDRLFFNGSSVVGITSVRIFNCIGSLVASKQFQSLSNASIEIADLKNGVYFIEIENNNSTSTQKVVVQH